MIVQSTKDLAARFLIGRSAPGTCAVTRDTLELKDLSLSSCLEAGGDCLMAPGQYSQPRTTQ